MNKRLLLTSVLLALASQAWADELGRVISSTPIYQQVAVPQQVCSQQPLTVAPQGDLGGTAMGALVGGVLGNQIGAGSGRDAATLLGIMGGAVLGNQMSARNYPPTTQMAQSCTMQTSYENRIVGYQVVYEYAGQRYSAQMPQDPGPSVRLQISPIGASTTPAQPGGVVVNPVTMPSVTTTTVQPALLTSSSTFVATVPPMVYPAMMAPPPPLYAYPAPVVSIGYSNYRPPRHWHPHVRPAPAYPGYVRPATPIYPGHYWR